MARMRRGSLTGDLRETTRFEIPHQENEPILTAAVVLEMIFLVKYFRTTDRAGVKGDTIPGLFSVPISKMSQAMQLGCCNKNLVPEPPVTIVVVAARAFQLLSDFTRKPVCQYAFSLPPDLRGRRLPATLGPLDEALLSTREHVDLCFTVREAGGTAWFEPNAVVTYVVAPPFAWTDLPYYLLRWSDTWGQASLRHFEQKWNLDANGGQLTNSWLRPHRQIPFRGLRARLHRFLGAGLGDRLVDALEQFLAPLVLSR